MNINSGERVIDNNDSTMDCELLKYHVASHEKDCAK
jgi:hypothetical protein